MALQINPVEPRAAADRLSGSSNALWRLGAWGGAAAVALGLLAFAAQTETGSRRLAALVSRDIPQALPQTPVATVTVSPQDAQIARLQAQVSTLSADRDQLASRLASLEKNLDDITGSIKRAEQVTQPQPIPQAMKSAPPAIAGPAVADARMEGPNAPPAQAAVPLPPERVASAPPSEPAPQKPEYGVALASATSVEVLHLQWAALKANFGPLIGTLRPIAAREQRGTAVNYRLVLGPLPNFASAQKLCARLNAAHAPCRAGKFSGEPL